MTTTITNYILEATNTIFLANTNAFIVTPDPGVFWPGVFAYAAIISATIWISLKIKRKWTKHQ